MVKDKVREFIIEEGEVEYDVISDWAWRLGIFLGELHTALDELEENGEIEREEKPAEHGRGFKDAVFYSWVGGRENDC